jgi:hypothetical protein
VGAADKAAILRVQVPTRQLLVLGAKRCRGLGPVTNQEVAWGKRPGCRWGLKGLTRWVQSGGLEYQGKKMPSIGLNAVSGRVPEEYGMEPTALDQLRKDIRRECPCQ